MFIVSDHVYETDRQTETEVPAINRYKNIRVLI
jgi:hypothetical protein